MGLLILFFIFFISVSSSDIDKLKRRIIGMAEKHPFACAHYMNIDDTKYHVCAQKILQCTDEQKLKDFLDYLEPQPNTDEMKQAILSRIDSKKMVGRKVCEFVFQKYELFPHDCMTKILQENDIEKIKQIYKLL